VFVVSNLDGSMRLSDFLYIPAEQVERTSVLGHTEVYFIELPTGEQEIT
jgi:hypothetical protein